MNRCWKSLSVIIIFFMVISLFASAQPAAALAAGNGDYSVPLINKDLNAPVPSGKTLTAQMDPAAAAPQATKEQVEYEVVVPWQSLLLEPLEVDGQVFVQVTLPGWTGTLEAGKPGLPLQMDQLGVPVGAAVTVDVKPGKAHTYPLDAPVLPVVTQTVEYIYQDAAEDVEPFITEKTYTYEPDPSVYGSGVFPGALTALTGDSVLRQQRIVSVGTYPVQYDASRQELIVYESLRVTVSFEGAGTGKKEKGSTESAAIEELLAGELLNYEAAQEYRQDDVEMTSPDEGLLLGGEAFTLDGGVSTLEMGTSTLPWSPPTPGYRVKVRATGLYQLTYSELQAKGLPVGVGGLDPRSFQLFNMGEEVAIRVVGETDGVFTDGEYIAFYGTAINSKYTWDNVYWLTYGNTTQGLRMVERDATPAGADIPPTYTTYRHYESNSIYLTKAPGNAELDRWMWKSILAYGSPNSWTTPIATPTYAGGTGMMRVGLTSFVFDDLTYPDHHVKILINGTEVGDFTWDGWNSLPIQNMAIPAGVLKGGINTNTVEIKVFSDTMPTGDRVYADWIELDYPSTFTAENNELGFKYPAAGIWQFQVGGFTNNQVGVYDVSSSAAPVYLTGVSITPVSSTFTAAFQDTTTASSAYWTGAFKAEQVIEADTASNLQSTANGADHIVITHQAFASSAAALSSYRAGQGMRALTVDVQDIYDEFNYGIVHPAPIHDFLAYTYQNWQSPAPSYVVLMGDGHSDPKNYMNYGRVSYIPPYLMPIDPNGKLETAADNRYVTIVGTDVMPDMMLGRFAVNTLAEADIMVNKVITYEDEESQAGPWQQQILVVADDGDDAGNFPVLSDLLLADELPSSYTATKVYHLVSPYTDKDKTKAGIIANFGKLLVNYIGHGDTTIWAAEPIFRSTDVAALSNGNQMPVILSMDCSDGYFINPNQYTSDPKLEALAEVVTRVSGKGAVASWSPSGEGTATGHDYLNRGFFNALFEDGVDTVGEATLVGKVKLGNRSDDLLDTFLLFGDPALDMPTVAVANVAPVITGQVPLSTSEDTPLTLTLSHLTVTDPDDTYPSDFTLSVLTGSNYAVAGNIITPAANYYGTLTVPVRVNDGKVNSNIYNLAVSVSAVNDAPMAVDDSYTTPQDTPLVLQASALKTNDTDVDNTNEQLSVTTVSSPTNGSLSFVGDTVTFTPTGYMSTAGFNYTVSDGQLTDEGHVTVDVSEPKTPQTITVNTHAPANAVYGTNFTVAATASSGLTVTYSSGNTAVCTNTGATFTMVSGSGTCPVQYDQAGDATYAPALRVVENVTAQKASQSINISQHAPQYATLGTTFNVAATASSGLDVTYSSNDPTVCTVMGSGYSVVSEGGTCIVQYDQPGNLNYQTAAQLVEYVQILKSHSLSLAPGWNLVSFNLVPISTAIEDVLASIEGDYTLVYAWDATGGSSASGNWKMYDPTVGYLQSLTDLTNGMGFWVLMPEAATLEVVGTIPTTTNISLLTSTNGWNLVGYPSAGSEALPGALTNHGIGSNGYSLVYAYHKADTADPWKMFDPIMEWGNDLTVLSPGWGYWIKVKAPATWRVGY